MNLREVGYDREWINLAQDRDRWRAYVRAAMNLLISRRLAKGAEWKESNSQSMGLLKYKWFEKQIMAQLPTNIRHEKRYKMRRSPPIEDYKALYRFNKENVKSLASHFLGETHETRRCSDDGTENENILAKIVECGTQPPTRLIITRILDKLEVEGTVQDMLKERCGRKRSSTDKESIDEVMQAFA
ncbi:hypothetical protein ANN_12675 [Periplaneta americana]|uniref:Uncharacterized protein n=1 Tax=Periplaneta americana TaxID=6978 RepID=A0ABQ8TH85_PERAM|nr:hypothetical protein ANN_12675 [Periplaneta americana]